MAFLPQPTLPTPPRRSSQITVSIRAAADGIISVSRRRRVYEFLSATTTTTPATTTDAATTPTTTTTQSSNGVTTDSPDPDQVRHQLLTRMQQREAAIKADSAEKAALWEAQLAELRKPPLVEIPHISPEPVEDIVEPEPVVSYYPSRSVQTAKFFGGVEIPTETKPSSAYTKTVGYSVPAPPAPPSEELPSPTEEAAAPAVVEAPVAPAASVPDLYSPPEKEEEAEVSAFDRIREIVEDAKVAVEDAVGDVMEAFTPEEEKPAEIVEEPVSEPEPEPEPEPVSVQEPEPEPEAVSVQEPEPEAVSVQEPEPEPVSVQQPEPEPEAVLVQEPEPEPVSVQEPEPEPEAVLVQEPEPEPETVAAQVPESETEQAVMDKKDRSIGEVILDAIVEGVPTPEPPAQEEQKPAVDKTELIALIDSGKVKNLTVTKLRRLLSQNGLKTSGRKAELIARLTSFAKAK